MSARRFAFYYCLVLLLVATVFAQAPITTNTLPNQVIRLSPDYGAHNNLFPAFPGSTIHDDVPGYQGSGYYNCLTQILAHNQRFADLNACDFQRVIFDSAANATFNAQALYLDVLQSYGKSANYSSNWRLVTGRELHYIFANRGIANVQNEFVQKNAAGDFNGRNMYAWTDGGWNAESDEGFVMDRVYAQQMPTWYHGTSLSTGVGLTMPLLSDSTAYAPPGQVYDANHTIDGGILLDISKGTISGLITGPSAPLAGSSYLNTLPTNVSLPISTAWGICPQALPNNYNPQVNVPLTCVVTLNFGQFTAGGLVWVAGLQYPEQAPITAVGSVTTVGSVRTQSITFAPRNLAAAGANIFQGSLQGEYLSSDATLSLDGVRSSYYAFGSIDGVNLIYGFYVQGRATVMLDCGTQSFCGGVTGRNGFHLYPGAEIIANHSIHHDPELEPNVISFSAGDLLEGPLISSFSMSTRKTQCTQSTPANGGLSRCIEVGVGGQGINRNFYAHSTSNYNNPNMYVGNGGNIDPPVMHNITGTWGTGFNFDIAPLHEMFKVTNMSSSTYATVMTFPHGSFGWDDSAGVLQTINIGSNEYVGLRPSAPSGFCVTGHWQFTQDGKISGCVGNTWQVQQAVGGNKPWSVQPAINGDGAAIAAKAHAQTTGYNDTSQPINITSIRCYADTGASTMAVASYTLSAGVATKVADLLTSPITCGVGYVAGTQSSTVTLAAGNWLVFTFTTDGTSTQVAGVLTGTHP